jgi:hypothetical protein
MDELEEAAEVGIEIIKEVHEKAEELEPWIAWTAVSTLIMALLSAIGALLAGITANEALLERTSETIEIMNRDRDQLEITMLASKHEILVALGKKPDGDEVRIILNAKRIKISSDEMDKQENKIESTMYHHERFAIGVTLLSIGITLSGMAVVSKKPPIWYVGLVAGLVGAGFVCTPLFEMM